MDATTISGSRQRIALLRGRAEGLRLAADLIASGELLCEAIQLLNELAADHEAESKLIGVKANDDPKE